MTEQEKTAEQWPEADIEFQGRTIRVRMPRPEAILVWQRTLRGLQSADTLGWDGDQVFAALERACKIINSVMVNRVDIDWLDDSMLENTVDLIGASEIIRKSVEAFGGNNREEKRAAKKASRKKVTT